MFRRYPSWKGGGHPFFPVNAFLARDLLLPSFTPRRRRRRR